MVSANRCSPPSSGFAARNTANTVWRSPTIPDTTTYAQSVQQRCPVSYLAWVERGALSHFFSTKISSGWVRSKGFRMTYKLKSSVDLEIGSSPSKEPHSINSVSSYNRAFAKIVSPRNGAVNPSLRAGIDSGLSAFRHKNAPDLTLGESQLSGPLMSSARLNQHESPIIARYRR